MGQAPPHVFARRHSRRSNLVNSMIDGLGDRQHRVAGPSGELRSSQIAPGDWVAALAKTNLETSHGTVGSMLCRESRHS